MTEDLRAQLFSRLKEPYTGEVLFDCLTDLAFFIKNDRCQYVVVNKSLAERCGYCQKQDLVGLTADQVYPAPLGQRYRTQDEQIMRTDKPILNELELQLYPSGITGWCLTNKVPLHGPGEVVVGLVGISKDLHAPSETSEDYTPMAKTIQHIQGHFDEPLKISELAAMAGLSLYQFEQRIHRIFELTAGQFIKKVRMDAALRQLKTTDDPIVNVAMDSGYSDQSTFTRQFKQVTGLSPAQYRRIARTRPA
jgi:AraC-like DNA-binding protein